jgi:hypothetical protein
MNEEYHKPFIKSMIIVALVTVFAMVSSRYVVDYYFNMVISPAKTLEYSSQKSYDTDNSRVND